jgi:hypothetical protein
MSGAQLILRRFKEDEEKQMLHGRFRLDFSVLGVYLGREDAQSIAAAYLCFYFSQTGESTHCNSFRKFFVE